MKHLFSKKTLLFFIFSFVFAFVLLFSLFINQSRQKLHKQKNNEIPAELNIPEKAVHSDLALINAPEYKLRPDILLPPKQGIYHGAFPEFTPFEDEVSSDKIKTFTELTGKKIVWAYFSNNWFDGILFPREQIEILRENGVVPFVRLMPRSRFQTGGQDPVYTLEKIIQGKFDDDLADWARSAKKLGVPLLMEFGTEMNGNWFTWSGASNGAGITEIYGDPDYPDGPEKFRDAYRHIINIFRSEEVFNITWFFHVNIPSYPDKPWNRPYLYYPGDDYIDWIGASVYGAQKKNDKWKLFTEVMDKHYEDLISISPGKPIAILEFGVIEKPGEDKSRWIEDSLQSLLDNRYPEIKAISYWHSKWINTDGSISNMKINSSESSLLKYQELINDPFFIETAIFSR